MKETEEALEDKACLLRTKLEKSREKLEMAVENLRAKKSIRDVALDKNATLHFKTNKARADLHAQLSDFEDLRSQKPEGKAASAAVPKGYGLSLEQGSLGQDTRGAVGEDQERVVRPGQLVSRKLPKHRVAKTNKDIQSDLLSPSMIVLPTNLPNFYRNC